MNELKTQSVIRYRRGYKYQLAESYTIYLDLPGKETVMTEFLSIFYPPKRTRDKRAVLLIKSGYAWDGPSGPTIDTKNFMRGSLVHDALYQLIRQGHLPVESRKYADQVLRDICRKDGMSRVRAWYVYKAVRWFAKESSTESYIKSVFTAPKEAT